VSALEGLEEDGAGELLECEEVKNGIISLFKPLTPSRSDDAAIWSQVPDMMVGPRLGIPSFFPGIMPPPADFDSSTWDAVEPIDFQSLASPGGFSMTYDAAPDLNCLSSYTTSFSGYWEPCIEGHATTDQMTTNNISDSPRNHSHSCHNIIGRVYNSQ
jgi:hypothetical protein